MVMNPFTRATLVPTIKTAAVYVTLMNHGAEDDQLLKVSTPAAQQATLHESKDENGVMQMREITLLNVPANATVELAPAGSHIMLTGLYSPLKVGDTLPITLQFARAGAVELSVPVLAIATAAPAEDHSAHQ
jgi:periplasmic copper chaperone A